jgi:hypothetical protein
LFVSSAGAHISPSDREFLAAQSYLDSSNYGSHLLSEKGLPGFPGGTLSIHYSSRNTVRLYRGPGAADTMPLGVLDSNSSWGFLLNVQKGTVFGALLAYPLHWTVMNPQIPHSRRFSSRVHSPADVYVCWGAYGLDDTSQVRDLSSSGMFLLTRKSKPVGSIAKLHFLVEEGQIRAEAIVRHVKPGCGRGMEFTAVLEEDRQRLAGLMKRLREFGWISKFQSGEHGQQVHPS